jgi:hypothetical protein
MKRDLIFQVRLLNFFLILFNLCFISSRNLSDLICFQIPLSVRDVNYNHRYEEGPDPNYPLPSNYVINNSFGNIPINDFNLNTISKNNTVFFNSFNNSSKINIGNTLATVEDIWLPPLKKRKDNKENGIPMIEKKRFLKLYKAANLDRYIVQSSIHLSYAYSGFYYYCYYHYIFILINYFIKYS